MVGWAFEIFGFLIPEQMFVIAAFYFAEAMLDCERALSAYPAWLGEMRSLPPPLWDCPPSEDGGSPLLTLLL